MTNHGIVDVMPNAMDLADGYKLDHRRQAPDEWSAAYENWTPRKSRIEGIDYVVQFGLQHAIKSYLIDKFNKEFFSQPKTLVCIDYLETIREYLGEVAGQRIGIKHIEALHDLQHLPIVIKALPEGTRSKIRVPQWTIATSKKYRKTGGFAWVPGYLETLLSCLVWGPSTSATIAYAYREIFEYWAKETGCSGNGFIPYQGHDFSFRGMYGPEAACMSGGAHLTSFVGTDTIPAIKWLKKYYHADSKNGPIGTSVAATEHAVMCIGTGFFVKKNGLTWERYGEAELAVFKRLITEVYPTGIVSIVSDTWNLWKVLDEYCVELKDIIMARDGKLVIRPDSGDPVKILTGYFDDEVDVLETMPVQIKVKEDGRIISHTEYLGVIQKLWTIFGGTVTSTGHRLLDSHVGTIYGDSITLLRAEEICTRLAQNNFASICWVAGIGSYTYQYQTRDTFGFALKATYGEAQVPCTDGCKMPDHHACEGTCKEYDTLCMEIQKDPITDDGTKKSLKGLIQAVKDDKGEILALDGCTWEQEEDSFYETVFEDGVLLKDYTLQEIRELLWPTSNT